MTLRTVHFNNKLINHISAESVTNGRMINKINNIFTWN